MTLVQALEATEEDLAAVPRELVVWWYDEACVYLKQCVDVDSEMVDYALAVLLFVLQLFEAAR